MLSVLSQYIVLCHATWPVPFIDVSVDNVMLKCLAQIYIILLYIDSKCSGDTPHLLFTLLTTSRLDISDYFPFRYFSLLIATYVSICNVVDYMD